MLICLIACYVVFAYLLVVLFVCIYYVVYLFVYVFVPCLLMHLFICVFIYCICVCICLVVCLLIVYLNMFVLFIVTLIIYRLILFDDWLIDSWVGRSMYWWICLYIKIHVQSISLRCSFLYASIINYLLYALLHSSIHPCIDSWTDSFIIPRVHLFLHSLSCLFIYPSIRVLVWFCALIHSFPKRLVLFANLLMYVLLFAYLCM